MPNPTRTLLQLREEVRQTADMENATTYLDDDEVTRYINEALSEWWDLLIEVHGQEWFMEEFALTTSPTGRSSYALTLGQSDEPIYIIKGVDVTISGKRYPLTPFNFLHRGLNYNETGQPRYYRFRGNIDRTDGTVTKYIHLAPMPDAEYTVTIYHIPPAPVLDSDTDSVDGFNGWEEFVVIAAAIRCLIKEESDIEPLFNRKLKLEARIRNAAGAWDHSRPEMVTDVVDVPIYDGWNWEL